MSKQLSLRITNVPAQPTNMAVAIGASDHIDIDECVSSQFTGNVGYDPMADQLSVSLILEDPSTPDYHELIELLPASVRVRLYSRVTCADPGSLIMDKVVPLTWTGGPGGQCTIGGPAGHGEVQF